MKMLMSQNDSDKKMSFVNYQLSIINFAINFQLSKFSKINVASLFDNLRIDNSLKIDNCKLKISGILRNILTSITEMFDKRNLAEIF
ncbi:MAG: hypothetical protein Q7S57_01490 [bacterium]|nr:hypothetical protein [bacterium]